MNHSNAVKKVALLAFAVLCAGQIYAADADAKSTAVAFAKTMVSGDKKAAHDLCTGTPEQFKTLDMLMDMVGTVTKFKAACDKKFGADNVLSKGMGSMPDMVAEASKSDYVIKDDVATSVDKTKPDEKNPMKLKKVDGKWKVDLASMGEEAAQAAQSAPVMKAMNDTTTEINADKYKTAEDAAKAFGEKMQPK